MDHTNRLTKQAANDESDKMRELPTLHTAEDVEYSLIDNDGSGNER